MIRATHRVQASRPREEDRSPLQLRVVAALGLLIALLIGLGYLAQSIRSETGYPIRTVAVEGDFRFLTPTYVQSLVTKAMRGGFFQLNVQIIQDQLLAEPWIAAATVERVWPDVIRVAIKEQVPAAQWGENALLNAAADIFAPNPGSIPEGLPRLNGPVGSESEVLESYGRIAEQLDELGLKVSVVSLSGRGAWTVTLSDDAQLILGRHDVARRLARFRAAFAPLLKPEWARIEVVDLRFTNGFAVTERPEVGAKRETAVVPRTNTPELTRRLDKAA
jgi:cell division protein FtsQ